MLIRGETPADIPAIHALNKAAFGRDGEACLIDGLRAGKNLPLSLVAIENGEVVGHIAFSPMHFNVKSVGLAPLAVAEKYRKQGVGASLVVTGIEKIKEMGFDAIFVLGSDKYYPRFGFRRAIDYGIKSTYPDVENYFFILELNAGALEGTKGLAVYSKEFFIFLPQENEEEKVELRMTAEESAIVKNYSADLIMALDEKLFADTDKHWRKTARIMGRTMLLHPDVPEAYILERLLLLVDSGRLEYQGNLRLVRFSEVRRPFLKDTK